MTSDSVLFGDSGAPVTSVMGFVDAPIGLVESAVREWRASLFGSVRTTPIRQGVVEAVDKLDPVVIGGVSKEALLETESSWTAWFDNSFTGGSLVPSVSYIASQIKVFGVVVVSIPDPQSEGENRWGARQLELYGPEQTDFINYVRTISVVNDGGRWRFDANGEVQPFEATENYRRRRVAERFSEEMLVEYCAALGLRPFDPSFFSGPGLLLETRRPELERISLAAARERLGIG